jgi:antitoxin YefM
VAITTSEARKRLASLIKQVNDGDPVEIVSSQGRAYLVAADDYESMVEGDYLLLPPNTARLMLAADEVRRHR